MWATLVICAALATITAAASCPPDFDDFGLNNNICYKVNANASVTWTTAFITCQTSTEGANVLSVANEGDFYPVAYYARMDGADLWTGLISIGGVKSWADNTPYDSGLDQFFSSDAGSGIYGYLSADDGLFHIGDGRVKRGYICYVDVTPPTTPAPTLPTTVPTTTPTPSPCEDDWEQYGDTCYFLSTDSQYWAAASHNCHEMDAEPVSIHENGVLTFLLLRAKQNTYWIGLESHNGTYVYEDATTTDDVDTVLGTYMDNWSEGLDCIALDPSNFPHVVNHRGCFSKLPFTCYKPAREGSPAFYPEWL